MTKVQRFFKHLLYKNTLLLKMVISYIITGSILLYAFSMVLTNMISNNLIKEVIDVSEKYLLQVKNTTETLLTYTNNYYYQLYVNDPIINNALYGKDFSRQEIIDISNEISNIVKANSIIDSIYVYNLHGNIIFTSNSGTDTVGDFYDKDIIKAINNIHTYKDQTYLLPRKIISTLSGTPVEEYLFSTVFCDVSGGKSPSSAMVININQKELQKLVNNSNNDKKMQSFIMNNKGIAVTNDNVYQFGSDISSEKYVKQILDNLSDHGNFIIEENSKKVLVSFNKSSKHNLYFVCLNSYSEALGNGNPLMKNIAFSTVFFIIMGFIIAVIFALIFYKPLYSIVKMLGNHDNQYSKELYQNEYHYLSSSFNRMLHNLNELQDDVEKYIPANKNTLLKRIIYGNCRWDNRFQDEMAKVNLHLTAPYFCVVIFCLDSIADIFEKGWEQDLSLLKYAILNITDELMKEEYTFEMIDDTDGRICILISLDAADNIDYGRIKHIIRQIQDNIYKYFEITFTASIGDVVNNICSIKNSYKNAIEGSQYRLTRGKNTIIEYSEIANMPNKEYEYPDHYEKMIIDNIKLGELEKIYTAFNKFIDEVKDFSCDEILLSVNQLILAAINVSKTIDVVDSESKFYLNFKVIQEQLKNYDTLEEIKEYICLLFKDIINVKNNKNERKNERKNENVINKVIEVINERYTDPGLCIEILADEVLLSPNYVRSMFREVTGQTISEYIAEVRFNKVTELLLGTNYTIKEIIETTGFSTTGYFFTAFKRYYGCTPDQYRKKFKLSNNKNNKVK